jgi:ADP-heptose:LPS heptosyltransferase
MSAVLEVTPRKQLSILIVQLGEVEEVFRSLMAVKAVKQLYPEMKFHFLVRAEHAEPLRKVDWISSILELPKIAEVDGVKAIALWVDQVLNQNYEILTNWTFSQRFSRMAAIITTLIPAIVKFGNYVRDDLTIASHDAWSMYREAWLRDDTIDQDIHHTDIITTQLLTALQIHAGDPSNNASTTAVNSRYFFNVSSVDHLPKSISKWIAVHPDSLDVRFEEIVEMILRRHPDCGVVILNDSEFTPEEISVDHKRVVNLSGKLNFDELASTLSRCQWLFAGRAPISELASLLSVRTIYWIENQPVITGEAQQKWIETGPYGNGNIAVRFQSEFQPEVLYAVWSHYQSEWFHQGKIDLEKHFENLSLSSVLNGLEVYRSRIRNAQEGGGVSFEPVLVRDTTFSQWMFRLRGQIARAWFCGWVPPIDEEVEKTKMNPELIKKTRAMGESLRVIEQLCIEGKAACKELGAVASSIKNPKIMSVDDREKIDALGKKLLELEGLMSRVVNVESELRGFLSWYQQLMHNLGGATLEQMSKETIQAFDLVGEGAELVHVYADKLLAKAKPKAVNISEVVSPIKES